MYHLLFGAQCGYVFMYYFQDQRALPVRIHVSSRFMEDLQWFQLSLQP